MTSVREQKQAMRQGMKKLRAHDANIQASLLLRDLFLQHVELPAESVVASYISFDSEIDPSLLAETLRNKGHEIVLPLINGNNRPLSFHRYVPGDALIVNSYGIAEPSPSLPAVEPDVLLVPLLAFDQRLYRLGYGGGYYDRTIQLLRQSGNVLAVGLGYSFQEVPEIPRDGHDVRLDKVITEIQAFGR